MKNLNSEIYKKALYEVEAIYNESMYNEDADIYRIIEIVHSLSDTQIECKTEFVNAIRKEWVRGRSNPKCLILGGWFGLLGHLMKKKFPEMKVNSVDYDVSCSVIGGSMFPEVNYITEDVFEIDWSADIILSSSVEHFDRDELIYFIESRRQEPILWGFQSNNWEALDSHINCSESLDEFIEYLPLRNILHSSSLDMGEYERYTVIGTT